MKLLLHLDGWLKVKPVHAFSSYSHLFLYIFLVLAYDTYLKSRPELHKDFWIDLLLYLYKGSILGSKGCLNRRNFWTGLLAVIAASPTFHTTLSEGITWTSRDTNWKYLISSLGHMLEGFFQVCQNRRYIYRFSAVRIMVKVNPMPWHELIKISLKLQWENLCQNKGGLLFL